MTALYESPFDGFPRTTEMVDADGHRFFEVAPAVLSPRNAKRADALGTTAGIGGTALAAALLLAAGGLAAPMVFIAAAVPFVMTNRLRRACRTRLADEVRIVLTQTTIGVDVNGRSRHFDRARPHRFINVQHPHAVHEREQNAIEQQRSQRAREVFVPDTYYEHSEILFLEHDGQRRDLFEVCGRGLGELIARRLRLCLQELDADARSAKLPPAPPRIARQPQPGDVPSTPGRHRRTRQAVSP